MHFSIDKRGCETSIRNRLLQVKTTGIKYEYVYMHKYQHKNKQGAH